MTDAAMRSASATKSSSTSIGACTDVEDELDPEDAGTTGETDIDIFPVIDVENELDAEDTEKTGGTDIDIFPVIVVADLVGVMALMPCFFWRIIPTAFCFFNNVEVSNVYHRNLCLEFHLDSNFVVNVLYFFVHVILNMGFCFT